ncbi:hypothetical protein L6R52_25715, partial [Myxococcota bacterium]|nr:hypothetical protein [Myxococcota bacterium]
PAPRPVQPSQPFMAAPPPRPLYGAPAGEDPWKNPVVGANQDTMPGAPNPMMMDAARMPQALTVPPLASTRPYTSPTTPPAPALRRDPVAFDEEHYRVVYNEFVGSKARLGEVVDNITFEGFSSKLRTSEKELIDRHGCKAVRFQVLVKDRQVSLRPQLVR